ncbi:Uncharacterised protein [Segatella copri]|nr:Uncharacterised protein [Segatella copri]
MSHSQQAPGALRQLIHQVAVHHDTHHHSIFQFQRQYICHRHGLALSCRIGFDTPYGTRFSLILVNHRLIAQDDILQFQQRFPFSCIQVFCSRLCTFRRP